MHIPDGFFDAPTSIGAAAIAATAVSVCLKKSKGQMQSEVAPVAGLTAVFIFAAQMINFPVALGTSGHLIGGALAAILIGPWAAILAMTVVLSVQALVFADGGLSALGLNITNMGIIASLAGYLVFAGLMKVFPKTRIGILTASGIAAFISVPLSALGFVMEYAIGGTATYEFADVLAAVTGVHILIGLGEAAITVLTVGGVLTARADLVSSAKKYLPKSQLVVSEARI
ncbi:MAG: Cobalt rane transport protein CbiM [Actinomycetota bacterium]|jgi:cobalt/nickel transport system permease protein